jgi:hypothetical protein
MAEKETIFIPRDFALIFKSIQLFFKFGPTEFNESFRSTLKGLKEPENDQNDQFLLMKPYNSDSILGKIGFLFTFKDAEIFQSINIFDTSRLKSDNSQELVHQVLKYTNFSFSPTQRLTIEFRLSDDSLDKAAHAVQSMIFFNVLGKLVLNQ